jgi:hypothetical protein
VIFATATKGEVRTAAVETLRAVQQALLSSTGDRVKSRSRAVSGDHGYESDRLMYTWIQDPARQDEIRKLTM